MDSEDTLFILYTSGSTGKPKGVVIVVLIVIILVIIIIIIVVAVVVVKGVAHTTGGYLLNAAMTTQNSFNIQV